MSSQRCPVKGGFTLSHFTFRNSSRQCLLIAILISSNRMAAFNARLALFLILRRRLRRKREQRKKKTHREYWVDPINYDRFVTGAYVSKFLRYKKLRREKFFR